MSSCFNPFEASFHVLFYLTHICCIVRRDALTEDNDALLKTLEETDRLFASVNGSRESAVDSSVLSTISAVVDAKARKMNTLTFSTAEFAEKLLKFMTPPSRNTDNLDWTKLVPPGPRH